tara:strand:+ start:514 stop:744 length:231 start_codon:yes stop_codon:yes gene_type:complete
MIDLNMLDVSGDDLWNSIDLLVVIGNIIFWRFFYVVVIKEVFSDFFLDMKMEKEWKEYNKTVADFQSSITIDDYDA